MWKRVRGTHGQARKRKNREDDRHAWLAARFAYNPAN
jgi:hypothetical protein